MLDAKKDALTGKRYTLQQQAFFNTDEARKAEVQLKLMVNDPGYNTRETYSSSIAAGTPFVYKHMLYLSKNPNISVLHYLSNLRLKTRIRS